MLLLTLQEWRLYIFGRKHKSAQSFSVANSFAILHVTDPELCKATVEKVLQKIHKFLQYTEQYEADCFQSTMKVWEYNVTSIHKMVATSLKSLADSLG